jgi:hypothetical protein
VYIKVNKIPLSLRERVGVREDKKVSAFFNPLILTFSLEEEGTSAS